MVVESRINSFYANFQLCYHEYCINIPHLSTWFWYFCLLIPQVQSINSEKKLIKNKYLSLSANKSIVKQVVEHTVKQKRH